MIADNITPLVPKPLLPYQELLLQAADLIALKGLAKCTQQDDEGRVCLHGALSIADSGQPYTASPTYGKACYAVAKTLVAKGVDKNTIGCGHVEAYPGMAYWNNASERTQEEVIETLREAARADYPVEELEFPHAF